jgi:hypothetical protein
MRGGTRLVGRRILDGSIKRIKSLLRATYPYLLGLSMPSLNGSAIPGRQTSWKRIYGKSAKLYMFVAQPWLKGTLQLAAVGDDEDVLARDNFEQVAVNELFGKYFDTQFFFELSLNTGFWVFTNFDSAARKFPFTSVVHCEDSLAVIDEQNTFD